MHKMQANHLGCLHRFVKVAIDRFANHGTQFFQVLALGMNTVTECSGVIAAIYIVLADFKDNFAHRKKTYRNLNAKARIPPEKIAFRFSA